MWTENDEIQRSTKTYWSNESILRSVSKRKRSDLCSVSLTTRWDLSVCASKMLKYVHFTWKISRLFFCVAAQRDHFVSILTSRWNALFADAGPWSSLRSRGRNAGDTTLLPNTLRKSMTRNELSNIVRGFSEDSRGRQLYESSDFHGLGRTRSKIAL